MLQNIDLRSLAEIHGNGRDVVSAYFAGAEGLESLSAREKQLRELLVDDELSAENFQRRTFSGELSAENFQRSMETIRELLEEHPVDNATGVCFLQRGIGVGPGISDFDARSAASGRRSRALHLPPGRTAR